MLLALTIAQGSLSGFGEFQLGLKSPKKISAPSAPEKGGVWHVRPGSGGA